MFISTVAQLCLTLCHLMDYRTPGFPVHHQLPELAQTHAMESLIPFNHLILCRPLLLLLSIFPSIMVYPVSQLFASGGKSIGAWASGPVFPMNIKDWFPSGLTGSSCSSRDSQESSPTPQFKSFNSSALSFLTVHLSHLYMTTGKTIVLTRWTFVSKVMSLLCNMLSRFVIAFLPRSKCLLISWLQSPSAVILEPKEI